ncbi:Esterase E4 [Orchesella cincta]|uniref:Esterase E4 n=1 Tax=Orchesella cincta TaxID=48709 RepID=A0A1D2MED9_ORCCI|nr:Esterase E4 [Orchesella cincta]
MFALLSTIFFNLFCVQFQCELRLDPPFLATNPHGDLFQPSSRLLAIDPLIQSRMLRDDEPLVSTNLGLVKGFKMRISETREIFSFTGVPYGESTAGENRFRDPVPRRPWKGTWDATRPSPMCLQAWPLAVGGTLQDRIRGSETCLHLDIYTPQINRNGTGGELLPVVILIPGGAYFFGDSNTYGPKHLLREDVIFVPINVRMEIFGWLSTGDEHASGNWALKDQALSIEFVHNNIKAFGGDPNKIIIVGTSSAATAAHLMLFTNHRARSYLKGVMAISGSCLNGALDVHGRVRELSDVTAQQVGCPTSKGKEGSSRMVECLRKIPGKTLIKFLSRFATPPTLFHPTLEPPGPSAFISEPPEVQYMRGTVPPIPLIITRTENELEPLALPIRPMLPLIRPLYFSLMPMFFHYGFRNTFSNVDVSVRQASFRKVHQFYFGKSTAPNFLVGPDFSKFWQMVSDGAFLAPMWKAVEYHYKVAPTYTYIEKINTVAALPVMSFAGRMLSQVGVAHGSDLGLLFNMSRIPVPLKPGSDIEVASRRLVNMIVNFAKHGAPLYRNEEGKLLNLWKPVEDIHHPIALEVGLVKDIKMIVDPVAASGRLKIWEEVVF